MDNSNTGQTRGFAGPPKTSETGHRPYNFTKGPSALQDAGDSNPVPWNIMNFYNQNQDPWTPLPTESRISRNQDPWTPLPTESRISRNPPGSTGFQPNDPSFPRFRNNHLPSECDTLPDSGYGGSRPTYSIDNNSVYDEDRSPEGRVSTHRIESLQVQADPSNEVQHQLWAQPRRPNSIATVSGNGDSRYYCQDCITWLRTKSEFKKHRLRHDKSFYCDVPKCTRAKEGFGTKNDLDRHKKSVHSDSSVAGARYVCRLGQCGIKDPIKKWPRADNFRSHLARVHKVIVKSDDDMTEYIYQQPDDHIPSRQDLQGVGSYLASQPGSFNFQTTGTLAFDQSFTETHLLNSQARGDLGDMQQSLDSLLPESTVDIGPNLPPVQEDGEAYAQSDALSEATPHFAPDSPVLGDGLILLPAMSQESPGLDDEDIMDVDDEPMEQDDPKLLVSAQSHSKIGNEQTKNHPSNSSQDSSPGCDLLGSESSNAQIVDVSSPESIASRSPPSLFRGLSRFSNDDPALLEILKGFPKELLESALKSDSTSQSSDTSSRKSPKNKAKHVCSECPKLFRRPCELKKHLKRHEKPYGCTFDDCFKTFGSKNDWKRHESSQHWNLETWKCDEKKGDGKLCDKGFPRRESFKTHLQHNHSMTDLGTIDKKLENCRVGRHCESRFWCGFCEKLIEVGPEEGNAWTLRCNHIDNHFCGREGEKKNIIDWKPAIQPEEQQEDDPATPGAPLPNDRPSLKRKPNHTLDPQVHKRRLQSDYMWKCCQCNSVHNGQTTSSCLDCHHQRCKSDCSLEMI